MKIILSRKGFDSAAGGVANPILPNGLLCPLPIPDPRSPIRYGDLCFDGRPLAPLVEDLTRGRITAAHTAHLDPDLNRESLPRRAGWRPIFGTSGSARGHLRNQGVGDGDLFLFYGWFRDVEEVDGRWRYGKNGRSAHILYGWLQIERRLLAAEPEQAPDWATYHPHFVRESRYWDDSVYFSAEHLSLPELARPLSGGGMFGRYRTQLQLSSPHHGRSQWRLPPFFHPYVPEHRASHLTYHGNEKKWTLIDGHVLLDSAKQGQEFVLDCDDYPEAIEWVRKLFERG